MRTPGSGGGGGWGSGPQGDGPDLEQTLQGLKDFGNKLRGFRGGWLWLVLLAVVIWLATGIYIVNPGQEAVVRRFGAMSRTAGPGIHYHWPRPIEQVNVLRVDEIRSMELGFRTISPGPPARVRPMRTESLMITGDENLVNVQVVVQYRISSLPDFLFNVADPEGSPDGRTLRDAAETALRGVAGSMQIDEILTVGRAKVQDDTKVHLQELMDRYQTGLYITEVKLQAVEPPEQVQDAFKDVVSAKEDRARIINEANAYKEDILPKARGDAERMVREAEAYAERVVRGAKGDADRFKAMLTEYRVAKDVTRQRLYLDTLQEVLSSVNTVVISGEVGNKTLPLLPMNRELSGMPGTRGGNTQQGGQ